jgi:hypothetical protein
MPRLALLAGLGMCLAFVSCSTGGTAMGEGTLVVSSSVSMGTDGSPGRIADAIADDVISCRAWRPAAPTYGGTPYEVHLRVRLDRIVTVAEAVRGLPGVTSVIRAGLSDFATPSAQSPGSERAGC